MKRFTVSFTMELDEAPYGENIDYTPELLHDFLMSAFVGGIIETESIQDMVILEA